MGRRSTLERSWERTGGFFPLPGRGACMIDETPCGLLSTAIVIKRTYIGSGKAREPRMGSGEHNNNVSRSTM